jgi:ABC-type transporter Mla subunit MlaD
MADEARDPIADVINLLAAPIAGGIRTIEQFRRGVDEMLRAVDNLNRTMENMNEAASRINRFMSEVEQPLMALIPQITRTVQAAEEITSLLEAPVRSAAPNIERITTALSSPGFLALPTQIGEMMHRLAPLTQLAENAGGLFGGLRLPGMSRTSPAPQASPTSTPALDPATPKPATVKPAASKPAPARPAQARRAVPKQPASKRPASKQPASKQTPAKRRGR